VLEVREHSGVSLATDDVILLELPVVGDGLPEALHDVGDALLEASAPQLDLLLLALRERHRGGGCSDGREGGATIPERDAVGAGEGGRCLEDNGLGGGGHWRRRTTGSLTFPPVRVSEAPRCPIRVVADEIFC
jgi:hypothetical protein